MAGRERETSVSARLARAGFVDVVGAAERLADPRLQTLVGAPGVPSDVVGDTAVAELAAVADPTLALDSLLALLDSVADPDTLVGALVADDGLRRRLFAVLGLSAALGEHLAKHPHQWTSLRDGAVTPRGPLELRRALAEAVGADPEAAEPVATLTGPAARDALRIAYRGELLVLAARDLSSGEPVEVMPDVGRHLSDLAAATLEAALAVSRAEHPEAAARARLAVIGMGKCGGRELNYVSDVDVVFVAEPREGVGDEQASRAGATLAVTLMEVCSAPTAEGSIWPVDAALRPEGKNGALVRTLASHVGYYERWAQTWEFQALLKARPVAGDQALGDEYVRAIMPMVWRAAERPNFVEDVQAMRRKVEEHVSANVAERQIKLGRGGLRDVEFAVQLLQLVHGRSDVRLRSGTTLAGLEALSTFGYVGRADAADLDRAYRFLRTLEHRLQLQGLRRTHVLPEDPAALRVLGRSMTFRTAPADALLAEWRRHAREVRRLHEKLFYRPLLQAVARLDAGEARLSPEAAKDLLVALGYRDPDGALRHLEALTAGVSRRAAIQRTLLPVMLGWFADAADPDLGLLAFRQLSDELGSTPWYLRMLRDEGLVAERLARVLASSRYAGDLLERAPEATVMFGDDDELVPRTYEQLEAEMLTAVRRQQAPEAAIGAVRAVRRRELLRTAVADVLGLVDVDAVGDVLTHVAQATVVAGLDVAVRSVEANRGRPLPTRFAVIAMGRFGGHELGYGSDADVVFVHEPYEGANDQDAAEAATAVANELRRLLALPGADPPLLVDADLRPEGRQGPLVRSLASYAAYYARWSLVWESQALVRAAPIAGDAELGERFRALIDPLRWPAGGLDVDQVREIRRLKARVEGERLPRGADPALHTKLGRGGLADVEWTVQLLQMQHGARVPGLRTTRTLAALDAAAGAGLIEADDAAVLAEAWRTATRVRNAVMLARGRPGDSLPGDSHELAAVARLVGYAPREVGQLAEDYRRVTRRARRVVEDVFYA